MRALAGLLSPVVCSCSSSSGSISDPNRQNEHSAKLARHPSAADSHPRGFAAEAAAQVDDHLEDIELVRSRIFGNHIGDGERSGRKVLRKRLKADKVMGWYSREPMAKLDPLFVDPVAERYALVLPQAQWP